ncbi:hypothetical protein SAMN03159304_00895 [Pseudomonas sp. NFACC24-1]|nr:hypothetical protein SAMN03159304_00895 [Pseudomonas sp. NFACC24-1]
MPHILLGSIHRRHDATNERFYTKNCTTSKDAGIVSSYAFSLVVFTDLFYGVISSLIQRRSEDCLSRYVAHGSKRPHHRIADRLCRIAKQLGCPLMLSSEVTEADQPFMDDWSKVVRPVYPSVVSIETRNTFQITNREDNGDRPRFPTKTVIVFPDVPGGLVELGVRSSLQFLQQIASHRAHSYHWWRPEFGQPSLLPTRL